MTASATGRGTPHKPSRHPANLGMVIPKQLILHLPGRLLSQFNLFQNHRIITWPVGRQQDLAQIMQHGSDNGRFRHLGIYVLFFA